MTHPDAKSEARCQTLPPVTGGLIRVPAFPWRLNDAGFIQAGHVLKLTDIVGSEAAIRFIHQYVTADPKPVVVTASVDRTNFISPIHAWEMIRMQSHVTRVWTTSMEVTVNVFAENFYTGEPRHVATSNLVFVAVDPASRRKVNLPEWQPDTETTRAEAAEADRRRDNRKLEGKVAPFLPITGDDDPVILDQSMTIHDANAQSNVFGGILLDLIDEVGALAAQEQALKQTVVGVRLDRMSFIAPTFIGETVEARAIVTKTWRTSMEVQVELEALNPHTGDRRQVASSYLVYVRVGADGRKAEVPPFIPRTERQQQRAEAADRRRAIRQQEERAS
ncbi:MAG: acyl-CoA thioesterase [Candidatus Melainabacteria bacterium]